MALEFNLQIDMFRTNTDEWEHQDSFLCAFNEGYFRERGSGYCCEWKDNYWRIGGVAKNEYNSYDLSISLNNKVYRTEEEALKALEEFKTTNV